MLLLVTNCRDITMDYVVAELRRRGQPFFRLNTEQLPQALCSMAGFPRDAWSISLDGVVVRGAAITGAYFRRPGAPVVPDTATDPGERAYIEAEWSSFLKSLYSRLEGRWLNSPAKIFMAEDKPMQLLLAQEIGFHVPQAFVTNDILCARAISALGQAIGKPLRQAVLAGETERVIFTSRLAEIEDEQAEAIRLTPSLCNQRS